MAKSEKYFPIALILPFFIFLLFGSLEPCFAAGWGTLFTYPAIYSLKIFLTGAAVFAFWPILREQFPFHWNRGSVVALLCGILGTALWVGLAAVPLSIPGLASVERAAFNPFDGTAPLFAWGFWTIRMIGLVLVVPVVEELFLRGFLLRWIQGENWRSLSVGDLNPTAWAAVLIYAAATHPEILAAVAWFSLVTWFVSRTKNFWDAVLFHLGTNAGLGVYVLLTGNWFLM